MTTISKPMSKVMKDEAMMDMAHCPQGTMCHVEFMTPDLTKAKAFYSEMFGWECTPHGSTEMMFQTPKNMGPCGCMMQGPASMMDCKTMIYVNCDDLGTMMTRAMKLGCKMIKDKTMIEGGRGSYCHMKAPDGNVWGLYCRK